MASLSSTLGHLYLFLCTLRNRNHTRHRMARGLGSLLIPVEENGDESGLRLGGEAELRTAVLRWGSEKRRGGIPAPFLDNFGGWNAPAPFFIPLVEVQCSYFKPHEPTHDSKICHSTSPANPVVVAWVLGLNPRGPGNITPRHDKCRCSLSCCDGLSWIASSTVLVAVLVHRFYELARHFRVLATFMP